MVQRLFDLHHGRVYRFLLRLSGAREVAEDLTQEVFVRAVRTAARDGVPPRELAWLLRVARNLWIDRCRRRSRRGVAAPLEQAAASALEPPQTLDAGLRQALDRLADEDRQVFLLREVGGLGYQEIAALSALSPAAVRSRIFRARRALRAALEPSVSVATTVRRSDHER